MAGTWAVVDEDKRNAAGGVKSRIIEHVVEFTADAADGSVPDRQVGSEHSVGLLNRVAVIFGNPAPTTLMVQVADARGVVIANADAETISASTDIVVNKAYVGELSVQVTCSTNSAKGTVSLLAIS